MLFHPIYLELEYANQVIRICHELYFQVEHLTPQIIDLTHIHAAWTVNAI